MTFNSAMDEIRTCAKLLHIYQRTSTNRFNNFAEAGIKLVTGEGVSPSSMSADPVAVSNPLSYE